MTEQTFDEYWTNENELWALSMKESFRQRDERLKKIEQRKTVRYVLSKDVL